MKGSCIQNVAAKLSIQHLKSFFLLAIFLCIIWILKNSIQGHRCDLASIMIKTVLLLLASFNPFFACMAIGCKMAYDQNQRSNYISFL